MQFYSLQVTISETSYDSIMELIWTQYGHIHSNVNTCYSFQHMREAVRQVDYSIRQPRAKAASDKRDNPVPDMTSEFLLPQHLPATAGQPSHGDPATSTWLRHGQVKNVKLKVISYFNSTTTFKC